MLRDVAPVFAFALALAAACSSTTTGTGPSSSSSSSSTSSTGGTTDDPTCGTRCRSKAQSCGIGTAVADGRCAQFCPATSAQISCLEAADCSVVSSGVSFQTFCSGATASTSSSGSTSSSTSSGCTSGTSSSGDLGNACGDPTDCTGFGPCPCKDGCSDAQPLTCTASQCVSDCSSPYVCDTHGGLK